MKHTKDNEKLQDYQDGMKLFDQCKTGETKRVQQNERKCSKNNKKNYVKWDNKQQTSIQFERNPKRKSFRYI